MVMGIIAAGADVNKISPKGYTPMNWVICILRTQEEEEVRNQIIGLLLDQEEIKLDIPCRDTIPCYHKNLEWFHRTGQY